MDVVIHRNAVVPVGVTVVGRYNGEIREYRGDEALYTSERMSDIEYYYLKYKMLQKGVELIHSEKNVPVLEEFVRYLIQHERPRRHHGRYPYGFISRNEVMIKDPEKFALARKIIEMRKKGITYRKIRSELGIAMSISTLSRIWANRELYEEDE